MGYGFDRIFSKEKIKMAKIYLKKCLTSLALGKCKLKLFWESILPQLEWLSSLKQLRTLGRVWGKGEPSFSIFEIAIWCTLNRNQYRESQKVKSMSTTWHSYITLWNMLKGYKILLQSHLLCHVHCCSIHNSKKKETT